MVKRKAHTRRGTGAANTPAKAGKSVVLTQAEWQALKAALDAMKPRAGRPFADQRRSVEAVIWRHRNGGRWRAIPAQYGPWWRAAQLHYRWLKTGLWERIAATLREAGEHRLAALVRGLAESDADEEDPRPVRDSQGSRVRVVHTAPLTGLPPR
jgi:transposase